MVATTSWTSWFSCGGWYVVIMTTFVVVVLAQTSHITTTTGGDSAQIKVTATRGLVIDAGSGGSRIHVYNWQPRIFKTIPPDMSYPTTDEKWSAKIAPGVAELSGNAVGLQAHLASMIDFAVRTMVGEEDSFQDYPIYFKATGGMRELNHFARESMMVLIRQYLSDKSFCPFYFREDFARVISGEEEAIYSWAGINFLMGNLLPESKGIGSATGDLGTYGTLDLGGASCQIAFFMPNQDISENLFRLQIGGQKHWNVYTKSFLSFGHNSARERHFRQFADTALATGPGGKKDTASIIIDYCLPSGYSEKNPGTAGMVLPGSPTANTPTSAPLHLAVIQGPSDPSSDQFDKCLTVLRPLLNKDLNRFCMEVYDGECSVNGAYQPMLPEGSKFIGTASYNYPWQMLLLPPTVSLEIYRDHAQNVCGMSYAQLQNYFMINNLGLSGDKLGDLLPYFCLMSTYVYTLLIDGIGFKPNATLTVLDEVNGNKVGWPLGAILYEINSLPWELTAVERQPWGKLFVAAVLGLVFGAIASFFLSRELHTDRILLIQSEEELNSMGEGTNRSMGSMGSIAPSESYSQHGSQYDHSQHDISDHQFHELERANSMESNPKNITNRIGSRVPFSIDHPGIGGESPFRQSRSNSSHNTGPHSTSSQRSSRNTSNNNSRRGSDPHAVNRQIQTPVLDRIGNFFNRLTSNSNSTYDAIPESSLTTATDTQQTDDRPLPPRV